MNEHTFFEWKRSERLTAALALAFCLLGLGLQRLPGVGFSGKLSWGLAVVCLVLLGLSRLSRRHRGWKILLRTVQAGLAVLLVCLSAAGGLGDPDRQGGRFRLSGGRGDCAGSRGQRNDALSGSSEPD